LKEATQLAGRAMVAWAGGLAAMAPNSHRWRTSGREGRGKKREEKGPGHETLDGPVAPKSMAR